MPDPFGLRADDELDIDEQDDDEGGLLGTRAKLLLGVATALVVVATVAAGAGGLLVSLSVLAGVTAIVLPLTLPGAAPARPSTTRPTGPTARSPSSCPGPRCRPGTTTW